MPTSHDIRAVRATVVAVTVVAVWKVSFRPAEPNRACSVISTATFVLLDNLRSEKSTDTRLVSTRTALFFEGGANANAGVASLLFQSNSPWAVSATASGFNLSGAISQAVVSANGTSTQFSTNLQLTGTPSASVANCANLTPIQQLFGFEMPTLWTSTASLTMVSSPVTQGCAALAFNGSGYQVINGTPFSTSQVSVNSALSVDFLVPGNQPNPSWLGALQMYLTCPSANVFNNYIGQVELTGLPQTQYSTLRFPLPSSTVSTLTSQLNDCAFSFAINVNATGQDWLFDNLRFTN